MSDIRPRRRALRSIGAVLAGLLVVVVLSMASDLVMHASGVFPAPGQPMANALWLLATLYRTAYGIAGGYVAARLAPDRPMSHAVVLGIVGIALSLAGTVATWNEGPGFGPKWYPLSLVATALPSSWAGGRLLRAPSSGDAAGPSSAGN